MTEALKPRPAVRKLIAAIRWRFSQGVALAFCALVSSARADEASALSAPQSDAPLVAVHEQATLVEQFHPGFRSPYRGAQSLDPGARGDETTDITVYLGARLWPGAEIWMDPEIDQGFGLSDTLGVDGFTSAEAYKIGRSSPYPKIQRLLVRQILNLGEDRSSADGDINQMPRTESANRLVAVLGKLSVVDVFDTNRYANNARTDFMNWALINTGTFDYAADAWGYSYGAALEWYAGPWTLRTGGFDLSGVPNNKNLDKRFDQYELVSELEHRHRLLGQPGAVRVTGFVNRGRMAAYADAVSQGQEPDGVIDSARVRRYRSRPGVSINAEQAVNDDLGFFLRVGHAEGKYEGYEFTDMADTFATGLSLAGTAWGRKPDAVGLATVVDVASRDALRYFAAGGLGILAGDGRLPHPGGEWIVESFYNLGLSSIVHLSFDYQFVDNPAFNRDRGPVSVMGVRLHAQL